MGVTFIIPGPLRPLAAGLGRVAAAAAGATVGEALEALWSLHPSLRDRILTEQGEVRPHVNVFVDGESIRHTGGLAARIRDGCEIAILPAVSGGAAA